ncbi:MAG: high-potential iron-sulfur protein [Xanthomonadaceae bacterium]|nr:high-potential iron-sulfur protein [Xanthomonadaceae bacterium]MDE1884453.1 high-potential iron-sulfur protein [Xanthomonadaceae bacterium]MDE2085201.1 high-potential iron-sulfur protein [Xanthomonadaceae bacterium]MDE2256672.1 high-potential iron-sulfur protein [Xanthomonadaceae bacterium]
MSRESDSTNTSRRRFFAIAGSAIGAAAIVGALPRRACAADLPHLSASDPTAQALHYNDDATKVDKAAAPTWKAGEACNNCNFFQGGAAPWGPCQLFPGKAVHRNGWCAGYAKKA